jgi:hypothetical protein
MHVAYILVCRRRLPYNDLYARLHSTNPITPALYEGYINLKESLS